MKYLVIVLIFFVFATMVQTQDFSPIEPSSGSPGDPFTINLGAGANRSCWWHQEDTRDTETDLLLGSVEQIDDETGRLEATVPDSAIIGNTYFIYCGLQDPEFRGRVGTFIVTSDSSTQDIITSPVQPEDYFNTITVAPVRPFDIGEIVQVDGQWQADVRFRNTPVLSQILNMRIRGANFQDVIDYIDTVAVHFEAIPYPSSFTLSRDGATGQAPGQLSSEATISVDLRLLSAGSRASGFTAYLTYFHVDPSIGNNERHDYLIYNQESAAARATSTGGQVRLTMWRTIPTSPPYANSDTTAGDGETIWLKNALNPATDGQATGNYAARVLGMVLGDSDYELDGSFGERACPELDEGCGPSPSIPALVFARVDHPEMNCAARRGLLNVRLGPGVEYGIVSRLMVCDPIAIVGRSQASNGRWWIQLYSDEPRWINVNFTDFDGDINSIPISSEWSTQSVSPDLDIGTEENGFIGDEYGETHFFESTSNSYIVRITNAIAPGTVDVVIGGTYFTTFNFNTGSSEFNLSTNAVDREHSLIIRYNEGVTGSYTIQVVSN